MLVDSFGRTIDYVRISVTDHCNLRCVYCMPSSVKWLPHEEILRNEEIVSLIDVFVSLGIKKVRFTGGEPLLRKGFADIIKQVRLHHPDLEICITTNGILLENFVDVICNYRVQKVNVSLDTLQKDTFRKITSVDALDRVLQGIEKINSIDGVECKINAVIMENTCHELKSLIEFATGVHAIRFIERMPLSNDPIPFVSADTLLHKINELGTLIRKKDSDTNVAAMYRFIPGWNSTIEAHVGIIPAVSHRFCSKCNRLRVTSAGMLRVCLHDSTEYNLKEILRGKVPTDISKVIQQAVLLKKKEHSLTQCDDTVFNCSGMTVCSMSRIGG